MSMLFLLANTNKMKNKKRKMIRKRKRKMTEKIKKHRKNLSLLVAVLLACFLLEKVPLGILALIFLESLRALSTACQLFAPAEMAHLWI
jgi:hypothetical protein